jgi:hypothetical protein
VRPDRLSAPNRPKESRQAALQLLTLKKESLLGILKYLKWAAVCGQPEPAQVTNNQFNVTLVPIERLTDEELECYRVLAEKGRAIHIDATALASMARIVANIRFFLRSARLAGRGALSDRRAARRVVPCARRSLERVGVPKRVDVHGAARPLATVGVCSTG